VRGRAPAALKAPFTAEALVHPDPASLPFNLALLLLVINSDRCDFRTATRTLMSIRPHPTTLPSEHCITSSHSSKTRDDANSSISFPTLKDKCRNRQSPYGSVVEHLSCKQKVRSSILRAGIDLIRLRKQPAFLFCPFWAPPVQVALCVSAGSWAHHLHRC
jgi:hypothetical protein